MKFSIKQKQLLRYIVVGGCSVTIDIITYSILSGPVGVSASFSKRVGFLFAATWAFFANKFFTFQQPVRKYQEPLLFMMVYSLGFVANSFVHDLILHFTGSKIVAFLLATLTSTIINFFGQKWLVFRIRT